MSYVKSHMEGINQIGLAYCQKDYKSVSVETRKLTFPSVGLFAYWPSNLLLTSHSKITHSGF